MLNKWNKQTVKNFLKTSNLFESVEKTVLQSPADSNRAISVQYSLQTTTNATYINDAASVSVMNSVSNATSHHTVQPVFFSYPSTLVNKETKKEDTKDKEISKLLKHENSDELLALYLNQNNPAESFKKIFKTSIEQNPAFPKSYEDIPVVKIPMIGPQEPYEMKSFFGDYAKSQYVEYGLSSYIDEVNAKIQE